MSQEKWAEKLNRTSKQPKTANNEVRKHYIHVTSDVRALLKEKFECTEMSVWRALNYDNDYPMSINIRKYVLENNLGILMVRIPSIETFHDYDGYMRQYLPNGAIIDVNKKTGNIEVIFNGEVVMHRENCFWAEIEGIQEWANSLR